jgi:hypothetical protein
MDWSKMNKIARELGAWYERGMWYFPSVWAKEEFQRRTNQ